MDPRAGSVLEDPNLLKPFWLAFLGPPWVVSLAVFAVVAGVRCLVMFSPSPLQAVFFLQTVAMWSLPFVFLTEGGRRQIGLSQRGMTAGAMLLSFLAGAGCALAFFAMGMAVYGDSPNNWCISIRNYLHFDEMRGLVSPLSLFALYALPAISLNPVGEEILFRGFIQRAFSLRFGPAVATLVNSVLFGLVYLYLHGIWHDATGFHLRAASAAIALCLMACIGGVFTLCRTLSGSLWPAMAAHSAFNLTLLAAAIHQFAR
jgi:hypothetical protein